MATLTSKSESTIFAGEKMHRHLSYDIFSLTTEMSRVSQNPRVPTAQRDSFLSSTVSAVCVHYFFASGCLST